MRHHRWSAAHRPDYRQTAVPSRDHNLIEPVLDDLDVSYSVGVAELEHFGPGVAGISDAPDRALGAGYSEVGAAEQDQIRIVDAKTHGIEI